SPSAPAACCAVVAVIVVLEATTTLEAAVPPMVSVAPATKPVPVTVMLVPPSAGPVAGDRLVTVGAGSGLYVKAPASAPDCVSGFVTATVTRPGAGRGGVVAVIEVALVTVALVAVVPPNVTVAPATKPV